MNENPFEFIDLTDMNEIPIKENFNILNCIPREHEYDEEETELISYGAEKLVFLEYVSEIFKGIIFDNNNLEVILHQICKENNREEIIVLPSYTFPIERGKVKPEDIITMKKMFNAKKKGGNTKYMLALIGFDQQLVGHYNIILWSLISKRVVVFDSLSPSKEYFHHTRGIIRNITPNWSIEFVDLTEQTCLQYTGGNGSNYPLYLLPHITKLSEEQLRRISLQVSESQNHFCYMWCIWFIHCILTGNNVHDLTNNLHLLQIDPLVVIKKYGYNILKYMSENVSEHDFDFHHLVRDYFCVYWDRLHKDVFDDNPPFGVIEIPAPEKCNNINECFKSSIFSI